jgi:hypothetical protein
MSENRTDTSTKKGGTKQSTHVQPTRRPLMLYSGTRFTIVTDRADTASFLNYRKRWVLPEKTPENTVQAFHVTKLVDRNVVSRNRVADRTCRPRVPAILFVECEEMPLAASWPCFENRAFSVLAAADGATAVYHLHLCEGSIGMLLLDMILHGVSSRDVPEEAHRSRPI